MRELLLCPPDHYGIEYEINPWMSRARGAETAVAQQQWKDLEAVLQKLDCKIFLVEPQPKLPDMVFTANAGLAVGRKFIPSNFRHEERAGEAPHFARWMEGHGYEVIWLPRELYFEGEGGKKLLANYGAHKLLPDEFAKDFKAPAETIAKSKGHHREWLDAIRGDGKTLCHFGYSGRLTEAVLLGNVAYRAGVEVKWDSAKGTTDSKEANAFLAIEPRKGWEWPM